MLIFRVFATHFEVGDFDESYERHFVKNIQHLFFFLATYYRPVQRMFFDVQI